MKKMYNTYVLCKINIYKYRFFLEMWLNANNSTSRYISEKVDWEKRESHRFLRESPSFFFSPRF